MTSAPINSLPQDGAGKGATHALEFNLGPVYMEVGDPR